MEGVQFDSPQREDINGTRPIQKPLQRTPLSSQPPIAKQQRHRPAEHDHEPQFSIQEEVQRLETMVAQLPNSRPQLIQFINQPDPYQRKVIKPHTLSEQTQMKIGAVKVIALRELMKNQTDLKQLSKDLRQVAQAAQDPTIRRIAKAADDSLSQGRSFFDDFLDGLEGLPL